MPDPMNPKLKGSIFGIIAAISYGMNPLGALFLYREGVNTHSVLFYRFTLAAIILGGFLLVRKKSFSISRKELPPLIALGVLFGISSLALFASFHYMDAGIACSLLFIYPVMVAVIMAIFFKEALTSTTVLSILLALLGIAMLYKGKSGTVLSTKGVLLVLLSSLTYALYIIVVNNSPLNLSAVKLTFYVLIFCAMTIALHSFWGDAGRLQLLDTPKEWALVLLLALVPTVISLITMVIAVHAIGSTPTAIMGALEPLTAVVIGIAVFGEALTLRLAIGIVMILAAVLLIIGGKSVPIPWLAAALTPAKNALFKSRKPK